ncbi:MAG: hypothetical protein EBU66_14525 [Bacteroidetes bacterium]|nr:hypothetical protein [bacterium]NBP65862.1 hypothetical protein [Bacteroidota bacterium]
MPSPIIILLKIILLLFIIIFLTFVRFINKLDIKARSGEAQMYLCGSQYPEGISGRAQAYIYQSTEGKKNITDMFTALYYIRIVLFGVIVYLIVSYYGFVFNDVELLREQIMFVLLVVLILYYVYNFSKSIQNNKRYIDFNSHNADITRKIILTYNLFGLFLIIGWLYLDNKLKNRPELQTKQDDLTNYKKLTLITILTIMVFTLFFSYLYTKITVAANRYHNNLIYYKSVNRNDKTKLQNLAYGLYYKAFNYSENNTPDVIRDVIKRYFKTNIRYLEPEIDGDSDEIISSRQNDLWMYMMHCDGEELKELAQFKDDEIQSIVKNTRLVMAKIRRENGVVAYIKKMYRALVIFMTILLFVILYRLIHPRFVYLTSNIILTSFVVIMILCGISITANAMST